MLKDIVIDTNVFVDATNPNVTRFGDSVNFLTRLISAGVNTDLKVDPGFSLNEARNGSRIVTEYRKHVSHGSVAAAVLARLFGSGRVKSVSSMPDHSVRRKINQIIRNKNDRVFLRVSISTDEKILVSHDYVDFQKKKRVFIKKKFAVDIVESSSANQKL